MTEPSGDDGAGFARSTGTAAARGAVLVAVAVVLGLVLLSRGFDTGNFVANGPADDDRTTTPADDDDADGDADDSPDDTTTSTVPTARPPGEVQVLVTNGAGVPGAASTIAQALQSLGYAIAGIGNAEPATATAVFFTEGYEADAQAVAAALQAPPTAVAPLPTTPPVDSGSANVVVVLAEDVAAGAAAEGTDTTTTTAATG